MYVSNDRSKTLDSRAQVHTFILSLASGSAELIEQNIINGQDALNQLIPGFSLLQRCQQDNRHHWEGDVLVHTAKVFSQTARLTQHMEPEDRFLMLIVALAHDIEKPATRKEEGGKVSFHGHAEKAAERSTEIARNFCLSAAELEKLEFLVRHHMLAHLMKNLGESKRLEIYKSPYFSALDLFQEADARSSWQSADGQQHGEVLRQFFEVDRANLLKKEEVTNLNKLLYGIAVEIITKLGATPGPYFGQMRKALHQAVSRGELNSTEEAKHWAKRYYKESPPAVN